MHAHKFSRTHMHTHARTHRLTRTSTHTCAHIHTRIQARTHVRAQAQAHTTHTRTHTHTHPHLVGEVRFGPGRDEHLHDLGVAAHRRVVHRERAALKRTRPQVRPGADPAWRGGGGLERTQGVGLGGVAVWSGLSQWGGGSLSVRSSARRWVGPAVGALPAGWRGRIGALAADGWGGIGALSAGWRGGTGALPGGLSPVMVAAQP